jgi:hypothetical protein
MAIMGGISNGRHYWMALMDGITLITALLMDGINGCINGRH